MSNHQRDPKGIQANFVWLRLPHFQIKCLLVGGWATPLKNMSSSIGMMKFPIYGKIKNGNQTTNQFQVSVALEMPLTNAIGDPVYYSIETITQVQPRL